MLLIVLWQYFTDYGPSFDLEVMPSYVRNMNSEAYLENIVSTVLSMYSDNILL